MLFLSKSKPTGGEPAAGPDLDRRVARELGLKHAGNVPLYSTDNAIALELAEWFSREWGWWHYTKREVFGGWTVGWIEEKQPLQSPTRPIQSGAPTRALAICRSILKVTESVMNRGDRRIRPHQAPPEVHG